jgi:hypothetical protein
MRTLPILALLLAAALAARAHAEPLLLVLDAPAGTNDHLSRFRALEELRISGSSEFSELGLRLLRARLPVSRFTVVDLRQESHGFAAGLPVSWEANHDWGNAGRTQAAVVADEERRLAELGSRPRAELVRLDQGWGREKLAVVPVVPSPTRTERQVVEGAGLEYARFATPDHLYPDDATTDRFVTFARERLDAGWMHFHCKAGIGRTTVFMTMADMMRNARRVPRDEIIRRQGRYAGYDLEKIAAPGAWNAETSRKRRDFVRAFYDYCRAASPAFDLSWSQWASARRTSR